MIAFAVDGPTPGNDSSDDASAVLMFTRPATPWAVESETTELAAAMSCGTVECVGFVRRGLVVGTSRFDCVRVLDGTYT